MLKVKGKGKGRLMTLHLRATGRHLPYGITQCYLCHPTQVNAPCLTPATCRLVLDLPTPEGWKV